MQSIQFDIEMLGLGSKAVTASPGAGGFDEILGRTRDDLPRPASYGETADDRPRHADRQDYSPQRKSPLDERHERSRDETTDRAAATSDDTPTRSNQSEADSKPITDRSEYEEPEDRSAERAAEPNGNPAAQESEALDTAPKATTEQPTEQPTDDNLTHTEGSVPLVALVPAHGETTKVAIQQPAASGAKDTSMPIGDAVSKPAAALEQAAANPALQRKPRQEASPQGDRNSGGDLVPGAKTSTTAAQGQDGKGSASPSRVPQREASGLEISLQKAPATSGSPTPMSSATALGVLQEQAVADAQKAEGESKALLRTAGQQKVSLAAESTGTNGQHGRQGSDLGQQKNLGTGQFLSTHATGGQGNPASSASPGHQFASTVLPAATGAEAAPSLTASGQPIPAATSSPSGLIQAAIQAAAPDSLRLGPSQQGPAEQVSVQIQTAVKSGADRISIQLNPTELGKIEVKMELGDDGQLRAVISAERPETLELLQKDARGLEKSLQDAGLKTDMNSLAFQKGGNDRGPGTEGRLAGPSINGPAAAEESAEATQTRTSLHDGSLDISV